MLSKDEQAFINYWEENREKESQLPYQLKSGLVPGIIFMSITLVVIFSGWYTRAEMVMNNTGSIIIILIALLVIVLVYAVFTKRQQWDLKEQQYLELKAKEKRSK